MVNQVSTKQAPLADTGDVALAHQQWAQEHGEYRPFDQLPREAQTAILALAQILKAQRTRATRSA